MKKYVLYGLGLGLLTLFIGLYIRNWYAFKAPTPSATEAPEMHIAFGVNDTYADPLKVSLFSLLWHNQNRPVIVHILKETLSLHHQQEIQDIVANFPNASVSFYTIKISDIFLPLLKTPYISKETFLRLSIPEVLPNTLSRVLYLDADTVIHDTLSDFYDTPFNDHLIVGVSDFSQDTEIKRLHTFALEKTINAGVLLMNLSKIRKTDALKQIHDVFIQNLNNSVFVLADQDIINVAWQHSILLADTRYNADMRAFQLNNPAILHYTTQKKPWNAFRSQNFYWHFYHKMLNTSYAWQIFCYTNLKIVETPFKAGIKLYLPLHENVIIPLSMIMLEFFL